MNGFLKFVGGVAVLGFVGLVGLSVMGIVAALVLGRSERHVVVPGVDMPPMTGIVAPGQPAIVDDVWPVEPAAPLGALAVEKQDGARVVNNTVHASEDLARVENVDITYPMTGYAVAHTVKDDFGVNNIFQFVFFTAIALVLASAFVILLRLTRAKNVSATPDETALVHELARRAQEMSQRMEALETILLDRARAAR